LFFFDGNVGPQDEVGGLGDAKAAFKAARKRAPLFVGGWQNVDATRQAFRATPGPVDGLKAASGKKCRTAKEYGTAA
jgi:hypothetical protein